MKTETGYGLIDIAATAIICLFLLMFGSFLTGCTTVNISTSANVGKNMADATVNGSAWAQVEASAVATKESAASTAGRSHPVSGNIVDTARVLGLAGIAAGVASGNMPLAAGGAGAVAGSLLTDDEETTDSR